MGRLFTLIIIFTISSQFALAQDNFIEHSIIKGESVYSISKTYGVSMNAIFRLNPGSEDIIYAGETLRVPTNNSTSTNTTITDNNVSNYEVKRGETKSGLARRFGVSIAMLEQQNPHIIRMLQAGHIINLDKSITELDPQVNDGQHRVVKGETLWGISRRYGVSLEQLIFTNEDQLSEFLQIGQVLIIPDKDVIVENSGEYIVKRGDTKFELSRRFDMTIEELESQNPHIIEMLMAGHRIKAVRPEITDVEDNTEEAESTEPIQVNKSEEEEEEEDKTQEIKDTSTVNNTNPSKDEVITDNIDSQEIDSNYVDYIIQPQETLYNLSKKADMTIEELTTLNPKLLTAVNAGDVIKMPIKKANDTVVDVDKEVTPNKDTIEQIDSLPGVPLTSSIDLVKNLDYNKTSGLYFYTPFSSDELRSSELRDNLIKNNSDYEKYVDFFQGAQLAIDSAKVLNLNFEITLIKNNNLKQQLNIESSHQENAILIPFLENNNNYPEISSNQTISVIDIASEMDSINNNVLFKSLPSKEIQKKKTLEYISNQDAEIIVVSDLDEAKNKVLIQESAPNAKFLKVDKAGFFKAGDLEQALSPNKLNYVILDSEKTIVFLNTTTSLMNQLANYDVQLVLIESSLIPKQNEVSNMRYRILKLIYPAVFHPENSTSSLHFETMYTDIYGESPSDAAILGFNVTFDVLLRLSQNTSFENTAKTSVVSEHSHLKFEYQKTNENTYSNTSLYLIQYDSNEGVIVLKDR